MKKNKEELMKIRPEDEKNIKQTSALVSQFKGYKITTTDQLLKGAETLKQIKTIYKNLEEGLDSLVAPSKLIIKNAKKIFDPPMKDAETVETIIKSAIVNFDNAEKKIADEHGINFVPEPIEGIRRTNKWKFRVINEEEIPECFFKKVLDTKLIEENLKEYNGDCDIPGIEAYQDTTIAVTIDKE